MLKHINSILHRTLASLNPLVQRYHPQNEIYQPH